MLLALLAAGRPTWNSQTGRWPSAKSAASGIAAPRTSCSARRCHQQNANFQTGGSDGLRGTLASVDCVWVNHPENLVSAAHKPLQLQLATEQGLEIPKTLITNDPDAAVAFWKECDGDVVYKTLGGPVIDQGEGRMVSIYTTRVRKEDLSDMGQVRHTACMFQQYVPKRLELRLTVIGDDVYTAEIHSQESQTGRVDWRLGYEDLAYGVHALPDSIRSRCLALTKQLGLRFAAIDMILTPDNRYVFVELNANGQWAWIEDHTGLALTAALADLLSTGLER